MDKEFHYCPCLFQTTVILPTEKAVFLKTHLLQCYFIANQTCILHSFCFGRGGGNQTDKLLYYHKTCMHQFVVFWFCPHIKHIYLTQKLKSFRHDCTVPNSKYRFVTITFLKKVVLNFIDVISDTYFMLIYFPMDCHSSKEIRT